MFLLNKPMDKLIKIGVLTVLVFVHGYSFAQLAKGSVVLNCNVGYTTTESEGAVNSLPTPYAGYNTSVPNSTNITYIAGMDAGYFVADNLTVGISLSYGGSITPATEEGTD